MSHGGPLKKAAGRIGWKQVTDRAVMVQNQEEVSEETWADLRSP